MYNTEQKSAFIRDYSTSTSTRTFAVQFFDQTEKHEEKFGGDICTMDVGTIQRTLDAETGTREVSRRFPTRILQKYAIWCMEHGVPGATDAALRLDSGSVGRLRSMTVRNPRHLQAYLDIICRPEADMTSDDTVRAYYWLAYSGLGDTEILDVTTDEVDFRTLTVRHGGKDYPIYREAIPALKNCAELKSFRYSNPNYTVGDIWRERIPGNKLLRGVRAVPSLATIRTDMVKRGKLAREAGKTDLQLSYYRIFISGVFYRMYEDELAGFPPDFSDFVNDRLGDFQYKVPPKGNTQAYKRKEAAEEYLEDYERWKQTLVV